MNKYGTAEHVEKVGDKAVISKRKLQQRDLEKILKRPEKEKKAEPSSGNKRRGKKLKRNEDVVVTDADYRQED
jgi:hypothetical protein